MLQAASHLLCMQPAILPALPRMSTRQKVQIPIPFFYQLAYGRFHADSRDYLLSAQLLFHHGIGIVVVDGLKVFCLNPIPAERIVTLCGHGYITH